MAAKKITPTDKKQPATNTLRQEAKQSPQPNVEESAATAVEQKGFLMARQGLDVET